jgi:hypothetical protein
MLLIFVLIASFTFSNSLYFECKYSVYDWVISGNMYMCDATVVFTGDPNAITGVSQNHLPGKTNADVGGFAIHLQPIKRIPANIDRFFGNIRAISMMNSTVSRLTQEDLKVFPRLEVFACFYNRLETIDGDVFQFNPRLQHLNLVGNFITNIGPNFLVHLPVLHQLYFTGNLCTNENGNTALLVEEVSRKLRFQCPPTPEMIEKFILSGEKFHHEIDRQTAERINPAVLRIYQNERRINELEQLVKELISIGAK